MPLGGRTLDNQNRIIVNKILETDFWGYNLVDTQTKIIDKKRRTSWSWFGSSVERVLRKEQQKRRHKEIKGGSKEGPSNDKYDIQGVSNH